MSVCKYIYIYRERETKGSKEQLRIFLNNLNKSTIPSSLNRRCHNEVSLFSSRNFKPETTNYTQRFIGKKETDKNFCILIQSILCHQKQDIA